MTWTNTTLDGLPASLPGTEDEALMYEQREAASPETREFRGGEVVIVSVSLFAVLLIVLIIVLIARD